MFTIPDYCHSSHGVLNGIEGDMFVLTTEDRPTRFEKYGCTVGECWPRFDAGTSREFVDYHQRYWTLFVPDDVDYQLF